MKTWIPITLLCLVIVAGAVLAYQPHFNYPFPLLGDEYAHISLGKYVLEEAVLPFTNPYFAVPFPHINFESGFDLLLAGLFLLTPGDPILFYKFFVLIFFILNSLLLYYLVFLLSKNYWAALFAVFFFGTIKSEASFLAHQYFLPLTLGVTLLLLTFIFFHLWTERRRRRFLIALAGTLVALALSYPPALFFFLGVALLYFLSMDHSLHEFFRTTKKKFLLYSLGGSAIVLMLSATLLLLLGLFEKIVFPPEWNALQTHFSPIFFFGLIPSTLAVLGLWTTVASKRSPLKIMLYWFLFSFGLLSVFYLFDFNVLIPAPRLFLFYLIGISILAGVGVATLIRFGVRLLPGRLSARAGRAASVAAIIVLVTFPMFHYYTVFAKPLEHHKILTQESYAALTYLKKEHPGPGIVFADSVTSLGVYPASGKHVMNLLNAAIGGGDTDTTRAFLVGDCRTKSIDLLDRFGFYFSFHAGETDLRNVPLFLLSPAKQNCPVFLDILYGEGTYLYAIRTNENQNVYTAISARVAVSGNTLEGDDWIEYYLEDGSVRGVRKATGEKYAGTWSSAGGPWLCIAYSFEKKGGKCNKLAVRDGTAYLFTPDGAPVPDRNAAHLPGNPHGL